MGQFKEYADEADKIARAAFHEIAEAQAVYCAAIKEMAKWPTNIERIKNQEEKAAAMAARSRCNHAIGAMERARKTLPGKTREKLHAVRKRLIKAAQEAGTDAERENEAMLEVLDIVNRCLHRPDMIPDYGDLVNDYLEAI